MGTEDCSLITAMSLLKRDCCYYTVLQENLNDFSRLVPSTAESICVPLWMHGDPARPPRRGASSQIAIEAHLVIKIALTFK